MLNLHHIKTAKRLNTFQVALICILFCLLVLTIFDFLKYGFFIDEIYSYGLSNSYYAPFVETVPNFMDHYLQKDFFLNYLTATENHRFEYGSVYYNQWNDVHPPLFYFILHTICSFFPGEFSKWMGLVPNAVFYVITLTTLYLAAMVLCKRKDAAAFIVFSYGLTIMAISAATYIRMYMLLTMFTTILAYVLLLIIEKGQTGYRLSVLWLSIFLGSLTQYYFVVSAFFLCAGYCIWRLYRKEYKTFFIFSAVALSSVLCMYLVYPVCIQHLFSDALLQDSGAIQNLSQTFMLFKENVKKLYFYVRYIALNYLGPALCCIGASLLYIKPQSKLYRFSLSTFLKGMHPFWWIGFETIVFSIITIAFVTPIPLLSERYIYNLGPFLSLLMGYYLFFQASHLDSSIRKRIKACISAFALIYLASLVFQHLYVGINTLYLEEKTVDTIVSNYRENQCIYFADAGSPSYTDDLLQLKQFESVYITPGENASRIRNLVQNYENTSQLVVYIDVSPFWGSGYNPSEILNTIAHHSDFKTSSILYTSNFSIVYALSK